MTPGCSEKPPDAALVPVLVDRAPARCADIEGPLKSEWSQKPPPPSGPQTLSTLKAAIDERDIIIDRKNGRGARLAKEYDLCQAGR